MNTYNGHTMNEWIDLMEGHTAWHRLLKYSQNQRFTTQLESMEGSQCESIGLYLSNNATTLSLEHPASVCKITLSLRTIFNQKEFYVDVQGQRRVDRSSRTAAAYNAVSPTSIKNFTKCTVARNIYRPHIEQQFYVLFFVFSFSFFRSRAVD